MKKEGKKEGRKQGKEARRDYTARNEVVGADPRPVQLAQQALQHIGGLRLNWATGPVPEAKLDRSWGQQQTTPSFLKRSPLGKPSSEGRAWAKDFVLYIADLYIADGRYRQAARCNKKRRGDQGELGVSNFGSERSTRRRHVACEILGIAARVLNP